MIATAATAGTTSPAVTTTERRQAIAPLLTTGSRGWLSQDDVEAALARLRGLDPRRFRDAQELVPLVEELYALLDGARGHADDVVLLICD